MNSNNTYICQHCNKNWTTNKNGHKQHEMYCSKNPNRYIRKNNHTKITEYVCQHCNKVWQTTKSGYVQHFNTCKENPNRTKHKTEYKNLYVCEYCGREKQTTLDGHLNHQNYCKENPNKKKKRKFNHTDETKLKISAARIEYIKNGGKTWVVNNERSYPEIWFADVILNNFNDKDFVEQFPLLHYKLDFAWPHKQLYIEIDGEQHYNSDESIYKDKIRESKLLEIGWRSLRMRWAECVLDKSQWINIAKSFIDNGQYIPFEKRYFSNKQLKQINREMHNNETHWWCKLTNDEWIERLNNLNINKYNTKKFGWITQASKDCGYSKRQIQNICDHFGIEWRTRNKKL